MEKPPEGMKILNFTNPDECKAALSQLQRNLPVLKEYAKIVAEYRYCQFQKYLEQGFTTEQALELTKDSVM